MAAYRRVYDSRHLQADCQEPGSAPEPYTLGNRGLSFTGHLFRVGPPPGCPVSIVHVPYLCICVALAQC